MGSVNLDGKNYITISFGGPAFFFHDKKTDNMKLIASTNSLWS